MALINAARLIAHLRELATIGKFGTGVDRVALSPADIEARRWLMERMCEAGLAAQMDSVGNVYGRYPNADRAVLIGSHTDTVPKGGWLDGALGVVYGLEIARATIEAGGVSRVGVDVVAFQDEEGSFLPCLGSRSFCRDVTDMEIQAAKSKDGTPLTEALAVLRNEGPLIRRDLKRVLCYLEAHIEQGPRLESLGRRIGVVTGLVGIRRFRIRSQGQADHAGTTPMPMRKDAGMALFRLGTRIADEFPRLGGPDTVWNIGNITLRPGAANVVPGEAEMTLEFRDTDPVTLDRLEQNVLARVAEANSGQVSLHAEATARIAPTSMAEHLAQAIAAAASEHGEEPVFMPSGAGHDAIVLGRFMPAGMLFVPSIGGRSHDIAEDTSEADIALGCEVLAAAVAKLRQQLETDLV
jgi:beta-ureidopropionase / N-carbamoyl-L-amino-acid hydrolase